MRSVKRKSPPKKRKKQSLRGRESFQRSVQDLVIRLRRSMGLVRLLSLWGATAILLSLPLLFWWSSYPQIIANSFASGFHALSEKAGFRVSEVLVEGRRNVPSKIILEAAFVKRGDSIFLLSPQEIKDRLEEITWVRQATVRRQLPDTLFLKIEERKPIALWQHQKRHFLVDGDGVIIGGEIPPEFSKLLVLVGHDAPVHAPALLKLLEKFPNVNKMVTGIVRVGNRRWDLQLNGSIEIKLPETNLEEALARLSLLLQNRKLEPSEVNCVDLRVPKQMILRLSPSAAIRLQGKGKEI